MKNNKMRNERPSAMILLVSDQTIPNLLTVLHYKPQRIYFIHSGEQRLVRLRENLQATISLEISDIQFINLLVEELNSTSSYDACRTICKNEGQETIVNVTGGTKLMSFGAYQAGYEMGARIIYVDTENGSFLDMRTGDIDGHLPPMSIRHFTGLKGDNYDPHILEFIKEYRILLQPLIAQLITIHDQWEEFGRLINQQAEQGAVILVPRKFERIVNLLDETGLAQVSPDSKIGENIGCLLEEVIRNENWLYRKTSPFLLYLAYYLMDLEGVDDIGIIFAECQDLLISTNAQLTVIRLNPAMKAKTELLNSMQNEARALGGVFTTKLLLNGIDLSRKGHFLSRAHRMGIRIINENEVLADPGILTESITRTTFVNKEINHDTAKSRTANTMILLVSDQVIPNYLAVMKFRPHNIYCLFTEEVRFIRTMENLNNSIGKMLPDTNIFIRRTESLNATTSYEICKDIISQHGGENTIINATAGTKPMSFGALQAGLEMDAGIIYVDTRQGILLNTGRRNITFRDGSRLPRLSVQNFINLCGAEIKSEDTKMVEEHTGILKKYVNSVFRNMDDWRALHFRFSNTDTSRPINGLLLDELKEYGIIRSYSMNSGGRLTKQDGDMCTNYKNVIKEGTPLELAIYFWAKEIPEVVDVKTSLEFYWSRAKLIPPDNELDVVLSCQSRLTIISCKMGNWDVEALDELEVYGELLGGTFVNKILVCYSEPKKNYEDIKAIATAMRVKLLKYGDIQANRQVLKNAILN